eukprot:c8625_g1_i1.p1 GENE.c8625_g1_i1~~c8625_g1_i1.p1  ORF type:complete len:814 (-),score=214.98 c8625_g1_i1:3-2444(-)
MNLFQYQGNNDIQPFQLKKSPIARYALEELFHMRDEGSSTPRHALTTGSRAGLEMLESRYTSKMGTRRKRESHRRAAGSTGGNRDSKRDMGTIRRVGSISDSASNTADEPFLLSILEPATIRLVNVCEVGLCVEVQTTVIECLHWWLRSNAHLSRQPQVLPSRVLEIFLTFGQQHQSNLVTCHWIGALRYLVDRYAFCIFGDQSQSTWCNSVLSILFNLLDFSSNEIRNRAACAMYMMCLCNFRVQQNLDRVRIQSMRVLGTILGEFKAPVTSRHGSVDMVIPEDDIVTKRQITKLKRILQGVNAVYEYAELDQAHAADSNFRSTFNAMVTDERSLLNDVIELLEKQDTMSMEEVSERWMSVARAYALVPDLQMQTYVLLSNEHKARSNWAEASISLVHASLIALEHMEDQDFEFYSQIGHNFTPILPQPWQKQSREEIHRIARERVDANVFVPKLLIQRLKEALAAFFKADLYEASVLVAKQLVVIGEKLRIYKDLSFYHQQMMMAYTSINDAEEKQTRFLGTYYRVGFFGQDIIPHLHQKQFIYKEPNITKLGEITQRLTEQLGAQVGGVENVKILSDSGIIDFTSLPPKIVHIQITHVEPYFSAKELTERVTTYEKNTKVSCFSFQTPFTLSGKKHGTLEEQQKRITCMTVAGAFPTTTTRLEVTNREVIELSPIQNATTGIRFQANKLSSQVALFYPNLNELQMILQGVVKTTVNEGAVAVAKAFLDKSKPPSIGEKEGDRQDLEQCLAHLVTQCAKALDRCQELIKTNNKPDMQPFHDELKKGYVELLKGLQQFEESIAPSLAVEAQT